jgi:UDP-hydrolysing UDP-N-acetyl-D-glucosamine 2-epimerase
VPTEEARRRLLTLGESDSRIRVLGSLALDNFRTDEPVAQIPASEVPKLPPGMGDYALVVFHPDPSEYAIAADICRNILSELKHANLGACVGYPNTDAANREIIAVFSEFVHEPRFFFYRTLERNRFISLYRGAKFIIGNSSSGILEAASIPIPAVNVGIRQRGRMAAENVLFVDSDRESVRAAIARALDQKFRASIANMVNPYGDGRSCARAYELIVNTDFSKLLHKTEDPLQGAPLPRYAGRHAKTSMAKYLFRWLPRR